MFRDLRVHHKILIFPLIALVFFGLSFLLNRHMAGRNKALTLEIQNRHVPTMELTLSLKFLLSTIQKQFQDASAIGDTDLVDEADQQARAFEARLAEARQATDIDQGLVDQLEDMFVRYYTLSREITLRMIEGDATGSLINRTMQRMQTYHRELEQLLADSIAETELSTEDAFGRTARTHEVFMSLLLAGTLVSVLLLVLFSFFLSRSITVPLGEVIQGLQRFAAGEEEIDVAISSRDEVGALARAFNQMAKDLRQTTVSKEYTERIVDSMGDALFVLAPEGRVQLVNSAACRLLELEEHQIVGRPFDRIVETTETLAGGSLLDMVQSGSMTNLEVRCRDSKGNTIAVSLSGATIWQEDGELAGMIVLARDLREIRELIDSLKVLTEEQAEQNWVKSNANQILSLVQSKADLDELADSVITSLGPLMNAGLGFCYVREEAGERIRFRCRGHYAFRDRLDTVPAFESGEGLVGKCARDAKRIQGTVPPTYARIRSGSGEARPGHLLLSPVVFEGRVKAVIELAAFEPFSDQCTALLDQLSDQLGVVFDSTEGRIRTENLLTETQLLADELRERTEETMRQSAALREANTALEQRTSELEKAQHESLAANRELTSARDALRERAEQLDRASRYKTDFLANMSHELRTPLNSILILSSLLASDERPVNSPEGRKYAATIHEAGEDLLQLINDILDLSKIEAGQSRLEISSFPLETLVQGLGNRFGPMAESKGLALRFDLEDGVPEALTSDVDRIRQVLTNLLSNAIKFTENGSIALTVSSSRFIQGGIDFSVRDTGIGIPVEKQDLIFEAFRQASGDTSRRYGGTGLGLSISRRISKMLGGSLNLESAPGEGSTFTLSLPCAATERAEPPPDEQRESRPTLVDEKPGTGIEDAETLLIVENDTRFVELMKDLAGRQGFAITATDSPMRGIELAETLQPAGIILDIQLPDMDGWEVLRILESRTTTRHIPVQVMSIVDERRKGLMLGAIDYHVKPVSPAQIGDALATFRAVSQKPRRRLLLAHDPEREGPWEILPRSELIMIERVTDPEAIGTCLRESEWDCLIVDGRSEVWMAWLESLASEPETWLDTLIVIVVVAAAPDPVTGESPRRPVRRANLRIVDRGETLLVETMLALQLTEDELSDAPGNLMATFDGSDELVAGRSVLIVDDDIRNLYALAAVLENMALNVSTAENGAEALEALTREGEAIDLVLMDITMPVMDGFEAMRRIREKPRFADLPIIAMTARAMREDRLRCLAYGATDYLPKPVDRDILALLTKLRLSPFREHRHGTANTRGGSD